MMAYTTLAKIREHEPCKDGWEKLLAYVGKKKADDEPLSLATILDSNGLDDALWCLRAVDDIESEARLFAVWCVRQVQHLMNDQRNVAALDVAERYARGEATKEELDAARAAARDAARDAAMAAAWDAAMAAAWDAARAAAMAAAWAVAMAAAWAVAWDAAWAVARDAQLVEFIRRFCAEETAHDVGEGLKP